jgi:hypothetical protein
MPATRSAINGESFGQNLIAAIPDVVAGILQRAIGKAAADEIIEGRIDRLLADPKTPTSWRDDPDARSTLRAFIDTGILSNRQIRGLIASGDVANGIQGRRDYRASQVEADGTIVVTGSRGNDEIGGYQARYAIYRPEEFNLQLTLASTVRRSLGDQWRVLSPEVRRGDPRFRNAQLAFEDAALLIRGQSSAFRRLFGHGLSERVDDDVIGLLERIEIPQSLNSGRIVPAISARRSGLSVLFNEIRAADEGAMDARSIIAMDYFIDQGWTINQSAGIVANLVSESRLDPGIGQFGGPAYGIAQWEAPRRTDFQAWSHRPMQGTSLLDQLRFVQYELRQSRVYSGAGTAISRTTTAFEAGRVTSLQYERPRDRVNQPVQRGNTATSLEQFYHVYNSPTAR